MAPKKNWKLKSLKVLIVWNVMHQLQLIVFTTNIKLKRYGYPTNTTSGPLLNL